MANLSFVTRGRVKSEKKSERQEGRMTQPRSPKPSIKFVDEYYAIYQNIFPEVRSFENFRDLHLGMISEIKRKSLPEIAKVVGLENQQSLHHFLTESPWSYQFSMKMHRIKLREIELQE
ncbi:hypothetical protein I8751_02820 [Nostocaceae cyanobacterium CENA357]|uniref:Transposase n=1 Tax=Atlanticothrix silvestris CENA357 TaxID=1725252 RepID=A0A8J7HF41_9CYAN|nr:hypothetical protein [Atlanticothrix silvestris CENA357]